MTKDMTQGSPMKLILGFSIPLLFGFLFQQFYNVVDTIIVGKFLGTENLAAVGATGSVFVAGFLFRFLINLAQVIFRDFEEWSQTVHGLPWDLLW